MGRKRKSGELKLANNKQILVMTAKGLERVRVRKPQAPRSRFKVLANCASAALNHRAKHYVVCLSGQWEAYGVDHPRPIKEFPHEDAAAMWLLHRSAR